MDIQYSHSKEVECYRDFVLNPYNRSASRAFSKIFGASLMEPAKKLHDRLVHYDSAGAYNADYGRTDNRIELKQGGRDKDPLVLKVRIGRSHRKFFHHLLGENMLLAMEWEGDFNSVRTICVIAVNNHDYKEI